MSYITDKLRPELDCRQIAERYGVRFRKRSSGWWLAHCFNSESHRRGDKNPSLSISQQGYKCFSANCAISGDAFSLIAHFEGLSPKADFAKILELASHHAGANHALLLLEERANHSPKVRYENPSQWRRHKKKQERDRREQKKYQLIHGKLPSNDTDTSTSDALPTSAQHGQGKRSVADPVAAKKRNDFDDLRQNIYEFMVKTLDPSTPPPLNDHFPDPFDDPFSIDPRHTRLQIMQRIWELLSPLPLSPAAEKWLEGRGIDPAIAHAYGCRDWSLAADDLRAMLAEYSASELEQAGLVRHQEGQRKLWTGLRAIKHEQWAQGLGMPVIHPGWPVAPIAWRWRLFNPFKSKDGRTFKAIAQYSGEPHMPSLPLGMTPLTAQALEHVAVWPKRCTDQDEPRYAVVLCEGEPDWLSVAEVSAKLDTDLYLVPIGLIAMSHGYPPNMSAILEGAERILCVMDRGNTNKKYAKRGGQVVVEQVRGTLLYRSMMRDDPFEQSFEAIRDKIRSALQADDFDVNDLHKQGRLRPLLETHLGDLF